MFKLKEKLVLSNKGYLNLKKAILACIFTNLSLMIPFSISIQIFRELLKPFLGKSLEIQVLWKLFFVGLLGGIIVFIVYKNDYKKTYINSYIEAENIRIRVAEKLRHMPMSFFNEKDLSEITTNIMGDCATSEHVLSHVIPQMIANVISTFIICLLVSFYDWRLSLAIFITLPLAFGLVFIGKKIQKKYANEHVKVKLNVSDKVQEYLEGIKVLKILNLTGKKFHRLDFALKNMKKIAIKFEMISGIFILGSQIILQLGVGLTVLVGTFLLTNGKISVIKFLVFILLVVRIYGPLLVQLTLLPELLYMNISNKRMRSLLKKPIMKGENEIKFTNYNINFKDVVFKYNDKANENTLKKVNFQVPEKKVTALVGSSGSGKSTIIKLLARFWDVDEGVINIGGKNIKSIAPEALMKSMSFVFQDVVLFNDTIYNNIKIGNSKATREEVIKAAQLSCCDKFIDKLSKGYETVLAENGKSLSGGERQRISIARALLKDAPIILLDEVTSSLDAENEFYIQKAISELVKNKTVLVIAHKFRTIRSADKILVLEDGKIIEEGSHGVLTKKDTKYNELYQMQNKSEIWSV